MNRIKKVSYRCFPDVSDDAREHRRFSFDDCDVRRRRRIDVGPKRRRVRRLGLRVHKVVAHHVVGNVFFVRLSH